MKDLQCLLFTMQDLKYKDFSAKITPILFSNAVNEVTVGNYKKAIFSYILQRVLTVFGLFLY